MSFPYPLQLGANNFSVSGDVKRPILSYMSSDHPLIARETPSLSMVGSDTAAASLQQKECVAVMRRRQLLAGSGSIESASRTIANRYGCV